MKSIGKFKIFGLLLVAIAILMTASPASAHRRWRHYQPYYGFYSGSPYYDPYYSYYDPYYYRGYYGYRPYYHYPPAYGFSTPGFSFYIR